MNYFEMNMMTDKLIIFSTERTSRSSPIQGAI